ncbi:mitochondrial matrix Mmp37-domain-containing protein [Melampsora americana]|nr:mitochondrial matrix Mmp37-domain-containing protein [Melampsora americana]
MYRSALLSTHHRGCVATTIFRSRPVVLIRKVSSGLHSDPSQSSGPLPHSLVPPRFRSTTGYRTLDQVPGLRKQADKINHSDTKAVVRGLPIQLPQRLTKIQRNEPTQKVSEELSGIIQSFKAPIRYAIGYGSGVFPQKSYDLKKHTPMLDFVFAVSHPSHWHSINLQQNPKHYSLPLRWSGSAPISWLQEKAPGAGVWFNVENEVNGKSIKYGVISVDTLCSDLLDWNTLYISGRMQKPVYVLRDDARVRLAQQVNLASALRTALLMLPENFTEQQLYTIITSLSYTGDFRMKWGENPRKIDNIVQRQIDQFRTIYQPLLQTSFNNVSFSSGTSTSSDPKIQQDMSPRGRAELLKKLPRCLKEKIETVYDRQWNLKLAKATDGSALINEEERLTSSDEMSLLVRMVTDNNFDESLQRALALTVGPPAFNQSVKGIISAGPVKSVKYACSKRK